MSLTIQQVQDQALRQADLYGTDYIAPDDLNALTDRAILSVWDFFVKTFGDDWDNDRDTIVTTAGQRDYNLPTDLWRLQRVGMILLGSGDDEVALQRFDKANGVISTSEDSWISCPPEYWLSFGNTLKVISFNPLPDAAYTIVLYYHDDPPTTAGGLSTEIDLLGYEHLLVYEIWRSIIEKQEEDPSPAIAKIEQVKQMIIDHAAPKDAGQPHYMSDARSGEDGYSNRGFFRRGYPPF